MRIYTGIPALLTAIAFLILTSCSTPSKCTDIKEYGYKGPVKSIVSSLYLNINEEDGEWLLDSTKIASVSTVTFNELGNMVKSMTKFPNTDQNPDVLIYSYEKNVKTGLVRIDQSGDTLAIGTYKWIDDFNYELSIDLGDDTFLVATSKLNENYRDLSGNSTYLINTDVMYSDDYKNTIDDRNLLTRIDSYNRETKGKSYQTIEYFQLDEYGNPHKLEIRDGASGRFMQLTTREFKYFE